jgi:hypothetical protein
MTEKGQTMKCQFCETDTQMTVRNKDRALFACCKECKERINAKNIKLWVSCVYKQEVEK